MDPEYLRTGQVSFGSDCYSFGVLLLQMITGRPPESNETPLQEHVEDALRYVGSALSLSPPPRLHPRRLSPWAPLTLFVCEVEVCASLCRSLTRGGCVSSHSTREAYTSPAAGAWPADHAAQLARLALRCAMARRRDRPNLAVSLNPLPTPTP
jgi:serine/threonine protein kinase